MVDYAKIQKKVKKSITKFGMDVTVSIQDRKTYVPADDAYTDITRVYNIKGLRRTYNDKEISNYMGTGKSIIQHGDVEFMVSDTSLPELNEEQTIKLNDGENDWTVVNITPLSPSTTVLFYKLQCRRKGQ